jgi:hypothetical protein
MHKRTWLAAICLTALALGAAVMAQHSATLVLRSGDRVSGELRDMGADFTMRVNGEIRHYPINDVIMIDLVGGGSGAERDSEFGTPHRPPERRKLHGAAGRYCWQSNAVCFWHRPRQAAR